ncbi:nucleotidyltransferase family protein [Nostoc spongiaeforme]|nr:nucleotidyltransferase family protein [Nostoc spongiaeforme]
MRSPLDFHILKMGRSLAANITKTCAIASPLFTDYLYQSAIAFLTSYRERSHYCFLMIVQIRIQLPRNAVCNDMKTLEEIKQTLTTRKPLLQKQYRVTELGVFGSYARGEQTQTSDVDILIDYEQAPTLFQLVELRDYLAGVVGVKVDVVTKNGLKPRIRERVLSEVVYV